MSDAPPFPWHGAAIMMATVLAIFALSAVTLIVVKWVTSARDEWRDRYVSSRWKPALIDALMFPPWLALEALCILAALTMGLLMLLLARQLATAVRDWWHAGHRG